VRFTRAKSSEAMSQGGLLDMTEGEGDVFQQETKYYRGRMERMSQDWGGVPEAYKEHIGVNCIELPRAEPGSNMTLDEILQRRHSVRRFTKQPVGLGQLSYLLWASTGIQRVQRGYEFRTTPSAGALYPIETYLVANNVESLTRGVYHYSIKHHLLEEIRAGDYSRDIAAAALGQGMCAEAAVVFIWTAIFRRSKSKYGQRAYRYVYLDAGHIGHALAISAVSLGLGSCQVGALYDDDVNRIVGVDGVEESVVYMSVVGHSA